MRNALNKRPNDLDYAVLMNGEEIPGTSTQKTTAASDEAPRKGSCTGLSANSPELCFAWCSCLASTTASAAPWRPYCPPPAAALAGCWRMGNSDQNPIGSLSVVAVTATDHNDLKVPRFMLVHSTTKVVKVLVCSRSLIGAELRVNSVYMLTEKELGFFKQTSNRLLHTHRVYVLSKNMRPLQIRVFFLQKKTRSFFIHF